MAGGYRIYRGVGRVEAIDWATPVCTCPAGSVALSIAAAGHVADTVYYYGVKALSDAGVESDAETRTCRVVVDGDGELVGPPAGPMLQASIKPTTGGAVTASWRYDQPVSGDLRYAQADTVEAAVVTGGVANWASPIGSWPVADGAISTRRQAAALTGTYGDGLLMVAFRAKTADDQAGPELHASCLVDSTAPEPVEYITAAAAG